MQPQPHIERRQPVVAARHLGIFAKATESPPGHQRRRVSRGSSNPAATKAAISSSRLSGSGIIERVDAWIAPVQYGARRAPSSAQMVLHATYPSSAWRRSAIRSSGCSSPIEMRSRLAGVVVLRALYRRGARWALDAAQGSWRVKSLARAATAIASSAPPCTWIDNMPPDSFICRCAIAWPGWVGRPG